VDLALARSTCEHVFVSAAGRPYTMDGLQCAMKRFGAAFKFRELRPKAASDATHNVLGHDAGHAPVRRAVRARLKSEAGALMATYTVQAGDTLSSIARRELGNALAWPDIWGLNPQIGNPELIFPGQVLELPPRRAEQVR
jgi:hypothetical protein